MNSYTPYYQESIEHPEEFWAKQAKNLAWYKPCVKVLERSQDPIYRWFTGGEINVCYNTVDRHVEAGRGDQVAIYFHSEMTQTKKSITYRELQEEVSYLAGVLAELGVRKGDRVVIYLPMIPEAVYGMLACARLGAIHSVVFGGFSAKVLSERIDDCEPKLVLAASCGLEPGKVIDYKTILDESLQRLENNGGHTVERTLIWQRPEKPAPLKPDFDFDWAKTLAKYKSSHEEGAPCVPVKSDDFLYILYTSGTTGNPKGVVRDNAGYLVALYWSMKYLYGVNPGDVYWAMSDIGWVVGHSYIVYAPLVYGCSTVLYEGKPVGTPDAGVVWKIISEYQVKVLFTAPTAIRAIVREDAEGKLMKPHNLSCLKSLFLAGERTDPATLKWAQQHLKVPVIDHWWQTETGWAICGNPLGYLLIKNEPLLPIKEGSCTIPMPGWDVQILDEAGKPVASGSMGAISIKLPLPPSSMPTIWSKNHPEHKGDQAFIDKYLVEYPGYYKTGDTGVIDSDGYLTVLSRNDDVINIAGHRISTGEVEEVIALNPLVAECAVVGMKDELKGEIPAAFVVLKKGVSSVPVAELKTTLTAEVRKEIGSIVVLKVIHVLDKLPKTRSGKILRATIRKIINHEPFEVPPTIEDASTLDAFKSIFNYPNAKL